MKTKIMLFIGLLMGAAASNVQGQVPSTNGLEAYYPLSGSAMDMSGNARDGTEVNGVSYVFEPEFSDLVASLNGISQYISLPNSISNYQDLTVSFWIKTGQSTPNNFPYGVFLVSRDLYGLGYDWNVCMGQGREIQFHTGTPSNDGIVLRSPSDIDADLWVHVACTADSASQMKRLFLNGQEAASVSWVPHVFENNSIPIFIGRDVARTSQPDYQGEIASLRIYASGVLKRSRTWPSERRPAS
jgi:hypothetical protein